MAKGAGILEASPGALAIVILFFLVVTLGFDAALHYARHALIRRKKYGLLAAINNFASEIMLLGLASLLLMAFETQISTTCYKVNPGASLKPWLSQVNGCACCLQKTKGVSDCFFQSKQCAPADERAEICGTQGVFQGIHHKPKFANADPNKAKNATKGAAAAAANNGTLPAAAAKNGSTSAAATQKNATVAAAKNATKAAATSINATKAAAGARNATAPRLPGGRYVTPPAATAAAAAGGQRRLLAAAEEQLDNSGKAQECLAHWEASYPQCAITDAEGNAKPRPGYAPIVTVATLHQVHMLLFVMASTHIVVSVLVLLITTTKLKFYARRGNSPGEDKLAAAALRLAAAHADVGGHTGGSTAPTTNKPASPEAAALDAAGRRDSEPGSVFAVVGAPQHGVGGSGGLVGDDAELVADPWNGRPVRLTTFWHYVCEALVYPIRQVTLLHTVSRQEYSVLRATFYLTHGPSLVQPAHTPGHHGHHGGAPDTHHEDSHASHAPSHTGGHMQQQQHGAGPSLHPDRAGGSYAPYVLESVERDVSKVVGLGLPMWVLVLVFVLVSGATGWAAWRFLIIAAGLLLFVNTILLASLRHMTRGGRVLQQQQTWYQWLHQSAFLLGCIKLTLFFFSFVVSNSIYFAGYFGPESCFFSRTGFQKNPVPWFAILLVDLCLLLNLALYTLPMYSLTTHTLKVDAALFQSVVADKLEAEEVAAFKAARKANSASAKAGGGGGKKGGRGTSGGGGQPAPSQFEKLQMAQSV